MLSVVIPSYKDPYLHKTIDSIIENFVGDFEIIVVLDGYWFETVRHDPRLRIVHLGKNLGMRGAINAGVSVARGEFIMRTDEHCMFAKGFDKAMVDVCEDNWIMTGIRYFLDPVKWEVMQEIPPFIYEKLAVREGKFEGQRWKNRDRVRKKIKLDETMSMQGSCWVMRRSWWDKVIVELQTEGYGPLNQDSHEMVFKTWKAGGKLMLNKDTWFAHKHYSFQRTHNQGSPENPGNKEQSYKYCLDTWGEYYYQEILPKWT